MRQESVLRLRHDRTLSTLVSHCVASPTLDLFALVLDNSSVVIYRANFQKLASLLPCRKNTTLITLCWRDDGSQFALSTSANDVSIYSVDTTAFTKRSARSGNGPLARVEDVGREVSAIEWTKRIGEKGRMVALGGGGFVKLMTEDLKFTVANVNVGGVVRNIDMKEGWMGGDGKVVKVDWKGVERRWREIECVAMELVEVFEREIKVEELLKVLKTSWNEGALKVVEDSVVGHLEDKLQMYEDGTNAMQVLRGLYCGARCTDGALQYFGGELTENGAKEVLRKFRMLREESENAFDELIEIWEEEMVKTDRFEGLCAMREYQQIGAMGRMKETRKVWKQVKWELEQRAEEIEAFLAWLVLLCVRLGGGEVQWNGGEDELVNKFLETSEGGEMYWDISEWKIRCKDIANNVCEKVSALVNVQQALEIHGEIRSVKGGVVAVCKDSLTIGTEQFPATNIHDATRIGDKIAMVREQPPGTFTLELAHVKNGQLEHTDNSIKWNGEGKARLFAQEQRDLICVIQDSKRVLLIELERIL